MNKNAMTNMHYMECKTKEASISLSKLNLTYQYFIVLNLSVLATVNNWPKTKFILRHMHMNKLELPLVWKSVALFLACCLQ